MESDGNLFYYHVYYGRKVGTLLIRKWAAADNQAGTSLARSLSLSFQTRRQGEGKTYGRRHFETWVAAICSETAKNMHWNLACFLDGNLLVHTENGEKA